MLYFCVSPQRSGTKAFGKIAKDFGFDVFSWANSRDHGIASAFVQRNWGMIDSFMKSKNEVVFEDFPYFNFEFVKYAFYNLDSKFIYLGRSANSWFESMLTHSGGFAPGREISHADTYERWLNLAGYLQNTDKKIDFGTKGLTNMVNSKEFYIRWYESHQSDISSFFAVADAFKKRDSQDRLFFSNWSDLDLSKLANFMGVIPGESTSTETQVHHATPRKRDRLREIYEA